MKKRLGFWVIWGVLMLCASLALAKDEPPFYLSFGQGMQQAVIVPQEKSGKLTLYIPGGWEGQRAVLHTTSEKGVLIDGETYFDGDVLPAFENGQSVTVRRVGKKDSSRLTAYVGSRIPVLMLSVTPEDLSLIHQDKTISVPGQLLAFRPDGSLETNIEVEALRTRGNTTHKYPKKPYQFKLEDKINLFGLGMSKRFVLLADYLDISLLRNRITYDMAVACGLPNALNCLQADIYINGEYRGLYLLTEKIEISDESVPIHDLEKETEALNTQPLTSYEWHEEQPEGLRSARWYDIPVNPEDVTGGYLLETDKVFRYKEEVSEPGFITGNNMAVYIKEPEAPSQSQTLYIANLVNAFHRAIVSPDGVDPESGKSFASMIDMPSFARKYLLEEISKNFDARLGSQYFYKDRGSDLLFAGPAWDYDLSYGNIRQEGFVKHSYGHSFYLPTYGSREFWYNNLIAHPVFEQLVIETYREAFHPLLEVLMGLRPADGYAPVQSLDDYHDAIKQSAEMNFVRWNPASIKDYYKGAGKTFDSGVDYLKYFLEYRLAFLDDEWME